MSEITGSTSNKAKNRIKNLVYQNLPMNKNQSIANVLNEFYVNIAKDLNCKFINQTMMFIILRLLKLLLKIVFF